MKINDEVIVSVPRVGHKFFTCSMLSRDMPGVSFRIITLDKENDDATLEISQIFDSSLLGVDSTPRFTDAVNTIPLVYNLSTLLPLSSLKTNLIVKRFSILPTFQIGDVVFVSRCSPDIQRKLSFLNLPYDIVDRRADILEAKIVSVGELYNGIPMYYRVILPNSNKFYKIPAFNIISYDEGIRKVTNDKSYFKQYVLVKDIPNISTNGSIFLKDGDMLISEDGVIMLNHTKFKSLFKKLDS